MGGPDRLFDIQSGTILNATSDTLGQDISADTVYAQGSSVLQGSVLGGNAIDDVIYSIRNASNIATNVRYSTAVFSSASGDI